MKRLCGILLALAGLFLYAPCAAQNTRVRGTVTDAQTGEPIPYAVVLFPGTTTGITTDDEGFYSLESRDTSSYIRAEMVSYEPQIRPVHVGGYNQIDFRLTPSHLEIESVVITPGDNPAHPILEGIIRNKKYNDSKEYDRYICRTYTKMELGLANIREFRSKKLQQNFGFIFEHLDTSSVTGQPYLPVMISETAADYYHSRTPSVAREVIRASQISGIEDNSVLAQFTGHLHADVIRGGDFGGSLRIDASSLTPQPEAMPFGITGFKNLDTLRIAGFTHVSELSLPTESCDDLTIENCGSQAPFTLSLPNLVEVRGTLLCRNCGKAGEANSASFPRLKNVGRQLSFYVGASSFTVLEFPLLETVGNGEPVSDDPADDYALYTMPSGCAGEFILPSLQRVNGSMLVSTWNTSTDRAVAFRFPSLQSVAGEISVGHTAYKNRSVATLDFSALTAAGAIRIGNLSSVTDFSTFTQVLPRLSEQTWSVTDCSYNPTYQQMLDGETGAESK